MTGGALQPLRVVITGASSGLGAALARHYAGSGAVLGLIARRARELERLAADLGHACDIHPLDVRNATALQAAARAFCARRGCPDIVIANAGVSVGTLTEHAEDAQAFEEIIDTNLIGAVNTFRPFIACMRERGAGTLAGIASVAGLRGLPGAGAYSASKAALIAYLESLRVELRGAGIKVVTVCPGYIATPMTERNPYPMPFRMSAEAAAAKIAARIARGTPRSVIPWQMALAARVLGALPAWLYDRLFEAVPRKPRRPA
ncbi:MAG TPA: SDR family oxidoreductase [Burkholderiales bacterium]|nr:SDR family oxidoreductase [Burkholderiales bacterium]